MRGILCLKEEKVNKEKSTKLITFLMGFLPYGNPAETRRTLGSRVTVRKFQFLPESKLGTKKKGFEASL